jgi:hypothetical protein
LFDPEFETGAHEGPAAGRPRRPALARTRTRTDRLKRQMLGMDKTGKPCACDDKTPCLAHAGITGRRRFIRPR